MSQGPASEFRTSSTSPHEKTKYPPPVGSRTLPPIQNSNSAVAPHENGHNVRPAQNGSIQQPPKPYATPEQRPLRPSGIQNLLNPASSGDSGKIQDRPRDGDHKASPPGKVPPTIPRTGTPSLPVPSMINRSPVNVSLPSITPPSNHAYPQPVRRSPSSYAPSPITTSGPCATMDVKQSPFVLPRDHNFHTGSGALNLPELSRAPSMPEQLSAASLQSKASPPCRRNSQDLARCDSMQQLVGRPDTIGNGRHTSASQSDSPSTQYSTYSQMSRQTPPAQSNVPAGQPQSFFTTHFNAGGPASTMAQMAFNAPASSNASGGSTYQMMTLDTENGPIQVPVDVQAASKVADEKRKRNATASHRFRQRRKEKERETSQNIAKLETQIRDVEEEREFYRGERDYFRNLASRLPGQAHLLSRPLSPRQKRNASMNGSIGFSSAQLQRSENGNRNSGRNIRRRTSSYVPPNGPPQPEVSGPIPQYQQGPPNGLEVGRGRPQEPSPFQAGLFNPALKR